MAVAPSIALLRDSYTAEAARIEAEFAATSDGSKAVQARSAQALWDLRMKLSPANRLVSECDSFSRDNPEFAVSLLDQRFLAGDRRLFNRLHGDSLPRLLSRSGSD